MNTNHQSLRSCVALTLVAGSLILASCSKKESAASYNEATVDSSVSVQATSPEISSSSKDQISPSNTRFAFGQAGLKLEKSADLTASCAKPDHIAGLVENLAVDNKGYVLSSVVNKVSTEHAEAFTSDHDSILSIDRYKLEANIMIAVPNESFEAVLAGLNTLPLKIESRTITQKDLQQNIEENRLRNELAQEEAKTANEELDQSTKPAQQNAIRSERSNARREALSAQLNLLGLDKRVNWSVVLIKLNGEPELVQSKVADLNALLKQQTTGGDGIGIATILSGLLGLIVGAIAGYFVGKRMA